MSEKIKHFILSEKQEEEIQSGNYANVLTNLIKMLDKLDITEVTEVDGPYTNGNKKLYLIRYKEKKCLKR